MSSDERLQFRPPVMTSVGLPDPIEETTDLRGKIMSSPENSCANYADSNAKDTITKPTRRRSRASRKTPMIVLTADAKNFRALVQQFTGCQSSPSSSFKGPINLNFGGAREEKYDIGRDQSTRMLRYDDFYRNRMADQAQQQQQQLEKLQQVYEDDQERVFSCGSHDGDASLAISGNPAIYSTAIDNMAEENAFLHHLPGDYSSNGLQDDDFFF